jgi:hypothetical protein
MSAPNVKPPLQIDMYLLWIGCSDFNTLVMSTLRWLQNGNLAIYKRWFSFFEPYLVHLASKFPKICTKAEKVQYGFRRMRNFMLTSNWFKNLREKVYLFVHICLCVLGESTTPHPSYPLDLFLYVNLGAKEEQKLFKTLAPQHTVLGIPHFSNAYSRTLHPIDL